jgi:hypothetical protein
MEDMKGHEGESDLYRLVSFMNFMPFVVEKSSPLLCRTAAGVVGA